MKTNTAEMVNSAGVPYGELIREYRRRKGLSQEQLGAVVHVKKNAVGAWEAGRSRPDVASIPALCRELEIPLRVFFGEAEPYDIYHLNERFSRLNAYNRQVILKQMDALYDLQSHEARPQNLVCLYLNDLSAAAGPVSYLGESGGEMVYLIEDSETGQADEIIRVSGDSMEPTFHNGDLVLVQHTERIHEGEIGIFVNGDAGYIKEYQKDGLHSHNHRYPPIRFSENDSVQCIGRVIGVLQPEQWATPEEISEFTGNRV